MVEKAIIHVGLAKTGTSSVQSFLARNKERLLENGILYPGLDLAHHNLQVCFSAAPEELIQMRREGITDRFAAVEFGKNYISKIEKEIAVCHPRIVLFSSEYFVSMKKEEKLKMIRFLKDLCSNVEIVAYLRDPWSFCISILQQNIRDGLYSAPVEFGYYAGNIEAIEPFRVLGIKPKVIPYVPFSPIYADVVSNFINYLLGDSYETSFPPEKVERLNAGLSFETACVLASFNKFFSALASDGLYRVDPIRDWASEAIMAQPGWSEMSLPKAAAEAIYESSYDDIRNIQNLYLDGEPIYWNAYKEMNFSGKNEVVDLKAVGINEIETIVANALYTSSSRAVELWNELLRFEQMNIRLSQENADLRSELQAIRTRLSDGVLRAACEPGTAGRGDSSTAAGSRKKRPRTPRKKTSSTA